MKRLMLAILTGFFPIYLNAESGGGSIFSRDAEAVEYTMEHKKDWGKKVLDAKLLAATQENARQ